MTDLIPAYETEGPLTVCPCCGEPAGFGSEDFSQKDYSCWSCWRKYGGEMPWPSCQPLDVGRAWMANRGLELRRAGKLPPLTEGRCVCGGAFFSAPNCTCDPKPVEEPQRWGVWIDRLESWLEDVTGSVIVFKDRSEAEWSAKRNIAVRTGYVYTVKPYPDAKQTSEAGAAAVSTGDPPGSHGSNGPRPKTETAPPQGPVACIAGLPEGGAAKVDPYASHRLAGQAKYERLMTERPKWVTRLAEVTERLADIDRELERLDRTERKS